MEKRKSSFNSILAALGFVLLVAMPAGAENAAPNEGDLDRLRRFEQHLFFKTSDDEAMPARVRKVEKRVFGQTMEGSLNQRIARLQTAIGAQVKDIQVAQPVAVDSAEIDMALAAARQKTASSENKTAFKKVANQTVDQAEPVQSAGGSKPVQEDKECALQRAKVAVLAAKEEEIRSLMSEGVSLWRRNRAAEAIEHFEQVIRLDPNNADAHYSMGIVYESQGKLKNALSSYREAARLKPKKSDYLEAIQAAQSKIARGESLDRTKSEIKELAVQALDAFKRREYQTALGLYKALDSKAPNQALVKYNIGTIYLMMQQPELAFDYYKSAYKLDPKEQRYVKAYKKLEKVVHDKELVRRQAQFQARHQAPGRLPAAGNPVVPGMTGFGQQTNAMMGRPPTPGFTGNPGYAYGQQMPGGMPRVQVPGMINAAGGMTPGMVPGLDCPDCHKKQVGRTKPGLSQALAQSANPLNSFGIMGSDSAQGVMVTTVGIASKASRAGLKQGDIIRAVDGQMVNNTAQINNILSRRPSGSPLLVLIQRNQTMTQLTL